MNIIRWMLVAAVTMAFLLLSVANWTPVPFRLPDGAVINPPLPLLLAAAFIAGWLPTWLLHIGARAGWRRQQAKIGKALDPVAVTRPQALPDQAQPIIVPPGG